MKGFVRFLPFLLFLALVGALVWRLVHPSSTAVPSHLAGKPIPAFNLPAANPGQPGLASTDLAGAKPHLVNMFASWCVPCITEIPLLLRLKGEGAQIVGIDVRDRPEALARFLAQYGNPFSAIGADSDSAVQLALGSSGVPETFVVDRRGIVRRQFIGGISEADLPEVRAELAEAAK
jgi:cytochrome c biogenesis protein CcmG/thiol:disulfide interchange protein DsbE